MPFKVNKRTLGKVEPDEEDQAQATSVPTSDVTNKAALQEKVKVQEIPGNAIYEFLLTEEQELWINGLADGIIGRQEALFPLVGKYLTGQAAIALKAEGIPP